MKFKTLEITNFMAIGEAKLSLADRGLVLIQGVNDYETSADSNGAGKSTIADALSWCLYGVTARGESGDDIVNDEAGKNCIVSVQVEEGDDLYTVTRHRKHSKGKNSLKVWQYVKGNRGPGNDLTKGTDKLTQEVVNKIIGCSLEVFNGAVYAGQERMPDLPGMTDKTLKMLIEEASGATLLEVAYVEANKRVQTAKNDAAAALANHSRAVQVADDLKLRSFDAHKNKDDFETRRLDDIRTMASSAQTKKAQGVALKQTIDGMSDAVAIRKKIAVLDAKIADVAKEQTIERQKCAAFDNASRAYATAGANSGSAKRLVDSAKQRLADLDHKVGCPCSSCDRPFSAEDIEPAKKLAAAEVQDAECDLIDAKAALDAALLAFKSAADDRDAYRASMTDLTATNAQRASLQSELDAIRKAEAGYQAVQTELKRMVEEIKRKRDDVNPFIAEIAKIEAQIVQQDTKVADLKQKVADAEKAQRVAESVAKVFSPTGVRAFLLDEVTPFLNDQTAKYLGTLSDGHVSATWTTLVKNAKGELREKFSIEVSNVNGGKKFGLVSGGEKRKVRIACALALQDLVARRATKPIELFIGDEIDDALDRSGQERLMAVLEEKAKERGSVLIVSHNDLKDWCRNTITVKRTSARSTIEEATS